MGVAGYIARRHLQAIRDTSNRLVAALDPHDSVGILDRYFLEVQFFREFERFDRHLEKLRQAGRGGKIDWVSICSPNYLHDAHIRFALRIGAGTICEKPLVLNPWNLDALEEVEQETGGRITTVLQLRLHPSLRCLAEKLAAEPRDRRHRVRLTYVTGRGPWYRYSWKGDFERSGGLATNIGIHFFDMLLWLFGPVGRSEVHLAEPTRTAGFLELERADVTWFLSVDFNDLPFEPVPGERTTFRSITVDGEEIEFSGAFDDLHTRVYEEILAGRGFGIPEARPSIELAHRIRHGDARLGEGEPHPMLLGEMKASATR